MASAKRITCPRCDGTGRELAELTAVSAAGWVTCPQCSGSGTVVRMRNDDWAEIVRRLH